MRSLFFFSVIFSFFYAAGQPVSILKKPYAVKCRYVDSVWEAVTQENHPDARPSLDSMEKWANDNGDIELALQFRLTKIRLDFVDDSEHHNHISAGTGRSLNDVAVYAHDHHLSFVEADAYTLLGEYWGAMNKAGRAFESELTAYKIFSGFTSAEYPPKQGRLYGFAQHYSRFGDETTAFRLLSEAKDIGSSDGKLLNTINNAIGMYYRNTGKYDSACSYFKQVYDRAVLIDEKPWIGIAAGNIGICNFYEKKYAEAIPLLEKDIAISLSSHQLQNAMRSMTVLAEIYFDENKTDSSELLLKQALNIAVDKKWWPVYKISAPIYQLMARIFARKNDMRQAYLYLDSAMIARDSINAHYNAVEMAQAKDRIELAEEKLKDEQLKNQKQVQILTRNGLIGGIVLLLIIGLLFVNRQLLRQKKLQTELDAAAIQLDAFRQNITDKNSIIDQITAEMERVKTTANADNDNHTLSQLQHTIILTDEQWAQFQVMFEKVHRNFFYNLKTKIPDLTQAEIRLLALTKLKLSAKEMAAMMGISPATIRIYRHRLRKKLEMDKEGMIEELLEDI